MYNLKARANNEQRKKRVFDDGLCVDGYNVGRYGPSRMGDVMKTSRGVYYFESPIEAENWAVDNDWPIDRINQFTSNKGGSSWYAIQCGPSGNYAGPGEFPRPWKGLK